MKAQMKIFRIKGTLLMFAGRNYTAETSIRWVLFLKLK